MKLLSIIILTFCIAKNSFAQDVNTTLGIPRVENLENGTNAVGSDNTIITGEGPDNIGSTVYNITDGLIYTYNGTNWVAINNDNIYNTNGTLESNRDIQFNNFNLQLNSGASSNTNAALNLRRTNNNNSLGIAFRNSGNFYDAAILVPENTNVGLDFRTIASNPVVQSLGIAMSLSDTGQIQLPEYGNTTSPNFLDNSVQRVLGISNIGGNIVEVDFSAINTDDQNAEEVPLVTNVDVNTTTTDPAAAQILETNVEEAIQAIAPITSKAGRVFYPPSIEIDVSTITQPGDPDETIDLHLQYVNQYDLNSNSTVINGNTVNYQTAASAGAPTNIPLYTSSELYYYVTFADASVFSITGISNTGILSYRVVGQPRDFNTLINVVFVVK